MRALSGFVPLHAKSQYSLGLGTASIPALVQRAGQLGFGALGLTDVENLYAQVQFHAACRAAGIRPVSGVELRPAFGAAGGLGSERGRLVLLASDASAYASVSQIVTQRRTGSTALPPPLESLGPLRPGVFLLTEEASALRRLAAEAGPTWLRALVVRPRAPGRESEERQLLTAARELGVALVADVDATLLEERDAALQRLVRAVHLNCRVDELSRSAQDAGPGYAGDASARVLRSPREIHASFADLPEALAESRRIAEACTLNLLARAPLELRAAESRGADADGDGERERVAWLEQRCTARLAESAPRRAAASEYAHRLATELAVIRRLGLSDLFCAAAALSARARELCIPVAARGSAVSSLALHLLGLSAVDPLEHGLYFERFVSLARRSPPDIDLDVASCRREELVDWFMRLRGPGRAARLSALHGLQRRSAHREGLKALGAPARVIESFLRHFPPDELPDDGRWPVPAVRLPSPWREQLGLLRALVGMPRQLALHPGGVVLAGPSALPLPLERTRGGALVTQYDAESVAQLGLPKIDLLGSHCLDEIEATLELLRASSGQSSPAASLARAAPSSRAPLGQGPAGIPLDRIPLEDAPTYELIHRAETLGCFQLESPAMRSVLASLPVAGLGDVTHALALVRPGPASGHAKELFLARARGEASEPALPAALAERLRPAHGLLLYEEDILFVLAALTGMSLARAEAARVRLGERAEDEAWMDRARARFLRRAVARGFSSACADQVWSSIVRFVRYSFNKAHATSQALLAYGAAYLKCHAPLEFGCALLNHHGGLYPRRVIAAELCRRNVSLLPPSLLRSELECSLAEHPRGIRIGLGLIQGLRTATRQRLLSWREQAGPAPAVEGLLGSVRPGPRELRALVWSGAFDELLALQASDYPWVHEAVLERLQGVRAEPLPELIRAARERRPREPAALVERYRRLSRIQKELEILEMHVSDHPMCVLRSEADQYACVPTLRLGEHVGRCVRFAGVIAATRSIPVALRDVAQFLTLEDEHGLVEAQLSAAHYQRLHPLITTPGPFLVTGRVQERHGALSLAIEELLPFHERARALPAPAFAPLTKP